MCQAFEAEQRFLHNWGSDTAAEGFFDAMFGRPFNERKSQSLLVGKDYKHGYDCWAERIMPWGVEREFHMMDNPAYGEFWKMRQTFKETGDFHKAVSEVPVEKRPKKYQNLDWVPVMLAPIPS